MTLTRLAARWFRRALRRERFRSLFGAFVGPLDAEAEAALQEFAIEHGRAWRTALVRAWYDRAAVGPLERMRTELGVGGLYIRVLDPPPGCAVDCEPQRPAPSPLDRFDISKVLHDDTTETKNARKCT